MKKRDLFVKSWKALPLSTLLKNRLPGLVGKLGTVLPEADWKHLNFVCSNASVSLFAKAAGFHQVIYNVPSYGSRVIADALIANTDVRLDESDCRRLFHIPNRRRRPVYLSEFGKDLNLFVKEFKGNLSQIEDPTKRALGGVLLWHLINLGAVSKHTGFNLNGILPSPQEIAACKVDDINAGVFDSHSEIEVCQKAMVTLIQEKAGDILYLDTLDGPAPYVMAQDLVGLGIDKLMRKGWQMQERPPFRTRGLTHELLAGSHFPVWVIANPDGEHGNLTQIIEKAGPNRQIAVLDNDGPLVIAVDEAALAKTLKERR